MNPLPVTLTPLIVTGSFPVEVRVKGRVAVVFTFTLPKAMLDALAFRAATGVVPVPLVPAPLRPIKIVGLSEESL